MSDTDRLAALTEALHNEMDPLSWAGSPCGHTLMARRIIASLEAAGVTLAPTPPDAPDVRGEVLPIKVRPAVDMAPTPPDALCSVCGKAHCFRHPPAPTPPDALDVERLALALHNTGLNSIGHKPGFHGRYSDHCICHPDAAQIAREYEAIAPKDFSTRIYKENRGE